MSESKRFVKYIIKHECIKVKDNENGKIYNVYDEDKDVVDLLNELATNCSQLQEENNQLKQKLENNYTVEMIDGKFFINLSDLVDMKDYPDKIIEMQKKVDEQQTTISKQEKIIKSQDIEISRQYNLCLAMSGVLREEFGVYDVFDRTKDRKID